MSQDKMLALRGKRAVWAPVPKGGATSWNDLTDKPFESNYEKTDIIPQTTMSSDDSTVQGYAPLVEGGSYTVYFGDVLKQQVEYHCVCKVESITEWLCLGNASLIYSGNEDSGEPFCIASNGANMVVYRNTTSPISVRVVGFAEVVTPLPEKFIPPTVVAPPKGSHHWLCTYGERSRRTHWLCEFIRLCAWPTPGGTLR